LRAFPRGEQRELPRATRDLEQSVAAVHRKSIEEFDRARFHEPREVVVVPGHPGRLQLAFQAFENSGVCGAHRQCSFQEGTYAAERGRTLPARPGELTEPPKRSVEYPPGRWTRCRS